MTERALKAIICDIDGVLADSSHRQHFLQQNPKNWQEFFDAASEDKLIDKASWLINALSLNYDRILYLSGRPEQMRETTEAWLRKHFLFQHLKCKLIMRGKTDKNADAYLKRHWYQELKEQYEIIMAIDSRPEACRMWRDEGVFCIRTAEVDF